jgi:hypothetical protein
MYKIQKLSKILSILLVVGVLGALALYTHTARSSALQNMSGFAWGGDWTDQDNDNEQDTDPDDPNNPYEPTGGVGWVSFNCTNDPNCNNDYGVNIEPNGDLMGYAWSSNYGWLKFGDLSGFPSGAGVSTGNARLSGNELQGWARFCAGAADPVSCEGTTPNPLNGGWDGWVSLKGPGYGVELNPDPQDPGASILSGYAWGGNDGGKNIVGWINFSTDFSDVIYDPVVGPTVSLTVESNSIPTGGTVELSWTGANLVTGPTDCEATGGAPSDGWPDDRTSPSGSFETNTISTNGTYTYNIRCMGTNGEMSPISSVTVVVGVDLEFSAEPSPVYNNQDPDVAYHTTLRWGVDPIDGVLTNCQATSSTPGEDEWDGADIDDPNPTAYFGPIYVPADPTSYTITCQNTLTPPQNVTKTILVYREELPASLNFWPSSVNCSGGLCTATLSWLVINGVSCEATSIPAVPPTGWEGSIPVSPSAGSQPGVIVPLAPDSTIYRLSCDMESGPDLVEEFPLNSDSEASQPPIYQEN